MSDERIPTSEKLAQALEVAGAPQEMIDKARAFYYDDYKSELAMPTVQLVIDAKAHNLSEIAERAINGDFDGTKEESDEWAKSPDGQETFAQIFGSVRRKKAQ